SFRSFGLWRHLRSLRPILAFRLCIQKFRSPGGVWTANPAGNPGILGVLGGQKAPCFEPAPYLFRILSRKLTDPESARWGVFWNVTQRDGGPLVCGAVNAKNQMGGYTGMTGLTYEPKED